MSENRNSRARDTKGVGKGLVFFVSESFDSIADKTHSKGIIDQQIISTVRDPDINMYRYCSTVYRS
jgi:hypothetical protein